ncbi:MAG: radical SAM protein [Clostridia bacterium]|nr:radical SAM protein [Clostridia bacterium]
MNCNLCPRKCNVDRNQKNGYCGAPERLRVARAALHMWEEPCISGNNGSGAVFFSGCTLRCVFCQNHDIAEGLNGKEISTERLRDIFLELQDKKANNINLVTPSHYVPRIAAALDMAKQQGLKIPIVYNTSSYENVDTLKMMDGLTDVYLPDMKYTDNRLSMRYSYARDYFDVAAKALEEMYRQVENPVFADEDTAKQLGIEEDMMIKGIIVRHLCLPGQIEDSKRVLDYVYENYGDAVYISIMNQYTPLDNVKDIPELNRRVTDEEYSELIDYAQNLGIVNGFIQEGTTALESFIPDFASYEGV